MSTLFSLPKVVAIDSGGVPYAGAKLEFFLTGTATNTNTYTDSALATPHANPVVADANGVFAPIYLDPDITYKATLTQSDDTLIYTVDPVSEHLSQANIGKILYPQTAAETAAGVTPVDFSIEPGELLRLGPAADGTTDDSSIVKAWASTAVNYSRLKATGLFRCESTVTDPGTLTTNQHGCLFDSLTGVVIDCSAATFVQTVTSSGAVIGGVIALKDCIDCTVIVRSTGYNDVAAGLESAASVALIGACIGCRVIGIQKGGGRGGVIVQSNDLTNAGDLPSHCDVISIADGSTRAVAVTHAGAGMNYTILANACRRSFFVDGKHGPGYAKVITDGDTTSAIRLRADGNGSVIDGLTI